MNTDYHYTTSRREGSRPRRRLNVLDVVVLLLTLLLAALLGLSYFAPWVNPNHSWWLAILGLASPVLYIANTLAMLYWMMRWRYYVVVPLLVLLLGLGKVSLFFNPVFKKHYDTAAEKPAFTVMSYNVEGFLSHDERNAPRPNMDSIGAFIVAQSPDILCMQEYQITPRLPSWKIDAILEALPHKTVHYAITGRENFGWGLAIYSRYPLSNVQVIPFENSSNCALAADVIMGLDTLRVFNCHLQTTSLTFSDRMFMTTEEFVQSDNGEKTQRLRDILSKLRGNYKIRAVQADSIATLVAAAPHPVILCGDFNDTPMSYTYRRMRGDMSDPFVEKGRGAPNTYRGFFNMFRIDYIFHTPRYRAVSYNTPESDISDHNPVVVGFSPAEK